MICDAIIMERRVFQMDGNDWLPEYYAQGTYQLYVNLLGPRPNTCFARDGKGLSRGTLVIRMQTLTLTRDWARDC